MNKHVLYYKFNLFLFWFYKEYTIFSSLQINIKMERSVYLNDKLGLEVRTNNSKDSDETLKVQASWIEFINYNYLMYFNNKNTCILICYLSVKVNC